jgi:NDP-sugar pyrophosphorylase family protein
MKIKVNLLYNAAYKIDSFNKLIGVLNEIQKPVKDVNIVFFPTKNNDENIFVEYKSFINDNLVNNRNPTYDLPVNIKMISMDSYVAKPIDIEGNKVTISKSVIGKSCKINSGTKILNSYLMDNCVIGKK